jgi:UDPglucose--hexose-1-phosphate uridylyltransferase
MARPPELRVDPLTGQQAYWSPERIPAPPAFGPGRLPQVASCPFCPGQEHRTGQTLGQRSGPDGAWHARAFPNRRPILRPEYEARSWKDGGLHGHSGVGAHEVVSEVPEHDGGSAPDRLVPAFDLVAERLEDLRRDRRFGAVSWYKNRGVEAGSSQLHPHSQVVAVPWSPPRLEQVVHAQTRDPGLFDALIDRARSDRRVVAERNGVVAFCPWASSAAFEVWLVPTEPVPWLSLDRSRVHALAVLMADIQARLDGAVGWCSYNAVLFDAPNRPVERSVRWHVRVLPRLVPLAGFEAWSGGAVQPVDPVRAAAVLRGFVP